jgi:hypothetical protein
MKKTQGNSKTTNPTKAACRQPALPAACHCHQTIASLPLQWWIHVEINKRSQTRKRGKAKEVDLADPKKSGYVGRPTPPD